MNGFPFSSTEELLGVLGFILALILGIEKLYDSLSKPKLKFEFDLLNRRQNHIRELLDGRWGELIEGNVAGANPKNIITTTLSVPKEASEYNNSILAIKF